MPTLKIRHLQNSKCKCLFYLIHNLIHSVVVCGGYCTFFKVRELKSKVAPVLLKAPPRPVRVVHQVAAGFNPRSTGCQKQYRVPQARQLSGEVSDRPIYIRPQCVVPAALRLTHVSLRPGPGMPRNEFRGYDRATLRVCSFYAEPGYLIKAYSGGQPLCYVTYYLLFGRLYIMSTPLRSACFPAIDSHRCPDVDGLRPLLSVHLWHIQTVPSRLNCI